MTKQKRFLLACALLVVCSVAVFSLSSRDYRVYWTARDGTVIGGVTPEGRLDTLSGAIHGGDVEITGDLVLWTSGEQQTPSAGTIVLWFDGTDLQVMNAAGETVNITSGEWNGE